MVEHLARCRSLVDIVSQLQREYELGNSSEAYYGNVPLVAGTMPAWPPLPDPRDTCPLTRPSGPNIAIWQCYVVDLINHIKALVVVRV